MPSRMQQLGAKLSRDHQISSEGMKPTDDIIVLALIATLGEVTSTMRAIALRHRGDSALFRFFMDSTPSEYERECAEVIATNFDAGHPNKLERLDIEFIETTEPLGKLDLLDFTIYRRYEGHK